MQFQKDKKIIKALIDFGNEVNVMTLAYVKQLGLQTQKTNVGTQKINGSLLKTYGIVIIAFKVMDKFDNARFFQKTILLANTIIEVVVKMLFFIFSNINI